jgi:hypothetical protein
MRPRRLSRGLAYPTRDISVSDPLQGTGVYLVASCLHASRARLTALEKRQTRVCAGPMPTHIFGLILPWRTQYRGVEQFPLRDFVTLRNCPSDNRRARWPPPALSRRSRDAEFDTVSGYIRDVDEIERTRSADR